MRWCPRIVGARGVCCLGALGESAGAQLFDVCAGAAHSDDVLWVVVCREEGTTAGSAQIVVLDELDSLWLLSGVIGVGVFCFGCKSGWLDAGES